jgi:hypothetical protein
MLAPFVDRQMSALRWLTICALLATSVACYRYVPTTMEAVQAGDHVRAVLSAEAQQDLQDRAGLDLQILEGKLLEDGDQVVVSVPTVKLESSFGAQSLHENIDVPRRDIVRVDVRQLDRVRTYGLIGLGAGVVALVTVQAFGGDGGPGSPNGGGGEPPEHIQGFVLKLPVIRW